jgi:hypothetical protein
MFRDALGRPEITPHNWISEQSRAGMPDEGLGIAAVGLEHFFVPPRDDFLVGGKPAYISEG